MFARLLPSLSHPPVGPSAFLPPPASRSLSLFVPLRARTPPSLHAPPPTPRPQHPGYPGTTPTSATGALPEGNRTSIGRITPVKIPAGTQAGASTAPRVIPINAGPAGSGMAGAGDQGGTLVEELSSLDGEPRGNTLGAIAWSAAAIGTVFIGAAFLTNRDTEIWTERLGANSFWRRSQPSQQEMMDAKRFELQKRLQSTVESLQKNVSTGLLHVYVTAAEFWLNAPEGKKFAAIVVGLNAVVFLGWKVPRLRTAMYRHWTHNPASGRNFTMLTSAFSHREIWHFALNMFGFWSFISLTQAFLVHGDAQASLTSGSGLQESTVIYHLAAFYVTAAIVSSLASQLFYNAFRLPALVRAITVASKSASPQSILTPSFLHAHRAVPSLGASGAIYAILFMAALSYPSVQVGIILIPFFSAPLGMAAAGLMLMDVIGILRGWTMFNHVAHLGGGLFGVAYWRYGCATWDWLRASIGGGPAALGEKPDQIIVSGRLV